MSVRVVVAFALTVMVGGLPDEITALQTKSADAACDVEPLITNAERQGIASGVFSTGELYARVPS